MKRMVAPLIFVVVIAAVAAGCSLGVPTSAELRRDMRDAYTDARTLYGYVWSHKFFEPSSEEPIAASLARLTRDFHRAELDAPSKAFEPGFRVALESQKSLLADASAHFAVGEKSYAQRRLRGMAANCIACHSRYQAPVDFIGVLPDADEASFGTLLAKGEYLFATRQFEKAGALFYELAQSRGESGADWQTRFDALKLWLVIEVRIKETLTHAAAGLKPFLSDATVPPDDRVSIKSWIGDLQLLASTYAVTSSPTTEAKRLLQPLTLHATRGEAERHLVTTLRATSLLHESLQSPPKKSDRREGMYLLARAYHHVPIAIFEPFVEQYLQMTIREFPHTAQARLALRYYEHRLSPSAVQKGAEGLTQLDELRALAGASRGSVEGQGSGR